MTTFFRLDQVAVLWYDGPEETAGYFPNNLGILFKLAASIFLNPRKPLQIELNSLTSTIDPKSESQKTKIASEIKAVANPLGGNSMTINKNMEN